MNIFKVLNLLLTSEHSHFISVDKKYYKRSKIIIKIHNKLILNLTKKSLNHKKKICNLQNKIINKQI